MVLVTRKSKHLFQLQHIVCQVFLSLSAEEKGDSIGFFAMKVGLTILLEDFLILTIQST